MDKILLNIKVLYNPSAILCDKKDNYFCHYLAIFFNIPVIFEKKKNERLLRVKQDKIFINDERLW